MHAKHHKLSQCCGGGQAPGEVSEAAGLTEGIRPEALDEKQIEDLIAEHLQQHLEILPEQDLANALHDFVDKVCLEKLCLLALIRHALDCGLGYEQK